MTHIPLPFDGWYALVFWLAYAWAFFISEWTMAKHSAATAPPADDPDQQALRRAMGLAFAAQLLAFALSFWSLPRMPAELALAAFWGGLALLLAGSFLRRHCFRMLGTSFTVDVRAQAQQQVVNRGAYALVRHPGYTAGIAMLVGVGLMLGNWLSLVLMTATALYAYTRRIRVEEATLERVIGEPYRAYAAGRKRLIPGIW